MANGAAARQSLSYSSSGGAIRLVCESLEGSGSLSAGGGNYGRIRLEANRFSGSLFALPQTAIVPPANPPVIWPKEDHPQVQVVSIGGTATAPDPRAHMDLTGADTVLGPRPAPENAEVRIRTRHLNPAAARVRVRLAPLADGRWLSFWFDGTLESTVGEDSFWIANCRFPAGYSAIQVIAEAP